MTLRSGNRMELFLRSLLSAATLAGLLIVSAWMHAQQNDNRPLPSLLPPGALLYLEAKDFNALLSEWNSSQEKKKWLASDNFGVLSESRLIQRLAEAQTQFASVAGVPIATDLVDQVAGNHSAFAFYDLPNLTFVYVTRMDSKRLNGSDLWNKREGYSSREISGIPFYEKSGGDPARTVAFASYNGWFVVATDEHRMADTLALLAHQERASLATESWFQDVEKLNTEQGDLRLVYNLTALLKTPQFRTYWIQRNTSELKPFSSGMADLFKRNYGFEERRALLRQSPAPAPATDSSLEQVLHYVPRGSALYRAWLSPDRHILSAVLQQVVLSEPTQIQDYGRYAPQVTAEAGTIGSVSDLETRIDEPPLQRAQAQSIDAISNALIAMQPSAILHVQTTTLLNDHVFVMPHSETVLICKNVNRAALERAVAESGGLLKTGSLDPLRISVSGNVITLSRLPAGQEAIEVRAAADSTYVAGYNNVQEWPHYKQLFALIDHGAATPEMTASRNAPPFFSGNLRSIGDTLARLQQASIVTEDQGAAIRDTVRYELSAP